MKMKKFEGERYKKIKLLMNSASFALLLSVVFFIYQTIDSKRDFMGVVDNLMQIENSLSTRYLGIFPEYVNNINGLLEESIKSRNASDSKDSVVIFEDVLYYGIRSDVEGFKRIMKNLLELSNGGSYITIAYYDPMGRPFKQMMFDKLVAEQYQDMYRNEMSTYYSSRRNLMMESAAMRTKYKGDSLRIMMNALLEKHYGDFCKRNSRGTVTKEKMMRRFNDFSFIDSMVTQRFYDSTRVSDRNKFAKSVDGMLRKIPLQRKANTDVEKRINRLCVSLDSVKAHYLNKNLDLISYTDYVNAYKGLSDLIEKMLSENENIEMLRLDETLMMSCWMCNVNGSGKAVFAFPSKYSTEEIGFASQDAAFVNYINTMLKGVRKRIMASYNEEDKAE